MQAWVFALDSVCLHHKLYQRNFLFPKFCKREFSLLRNFVKSKFRLRRPGFSCEISANFRENKGRNSANFALITFTQYCVIYNSTFLISCTVVFWTAWDNDVKPGIKKLLNTWLHRTQSNSKLTVVNRGNPTTRPPAACNDKDVFKDVIMVMYVCKQSPNTSVLVHPANSTVKCRQKWQRTLSKHGFMAGTLHEARHLPVEICGKLCLL